MANAALDALAGVTEIVLTSGGYCWFDVILGTKWATDLVISSIKPAILRVTLIPQLCDALPGFESFRMAVWKMTERDRKTEVEGDDQTLQQLGDSVSQALTAGTDDRVGLPL